VQKGFKLFIRNISTFAQSNFLIYNEPPNVSPSTNCGASFAIIIFSLPRANFAKKTVEYRVCRCFCYLKFAKKNNWQKKKQMSS
jgi:hypothetical protein